MDVAVFDEWLLPICVYGYDFLVYAFLERSQQKMIDIDCLESAVCLALLLRRTLRRTQDSFLLNLDSHLDGNHWRSPSRCRL